MKARWMRPLLGLAMGFAAASASAQDFSGHLDDPANAALVASDLGAARFANEFEIANNVALYDLSVPIAGLVSITSTGFAAGGADPYFTLFAGSGSAATFFASNYEQAFSTGGDFSYAASLAAGVYRLAIGAFANMSFAENFGSGSLADGFIALGTPGSLGDASYRVLVTSAVPEVSAGKLLVVGLLMGLLVGPLRLALAKRTKPSRAVASQARVSVWQAAIALAAGLALATPLVHAATAGGSVRTSALDAPHVPSADVRTGGGESSSPPVVSYTVNSLAGDSMAHAQVSVDGYTGAVRAWFSAQVNATSYLAGRNGSANGVASRSGSIGIAGNAPPGVATFTAVLEGTYLSQFVATGPPPPVPEPAMPLLFSIGLIAIPLARRRFKLKHERAA